MYESGNERQAMAAGTNSARETTIFEQINKVMCSEQVDTEYLIAVLEDKLQFILSPGADGPGPGNASPAEPTGLPVHNQAHSVMLDRTEQQRHINGSLRRLLSRINM